MMLLVSENEWHLRADFGCPPPYCLVHLYSVIIIKFLFLLPKNRQLQTLLVYQLFHVVSTLAYHMRISSSTYRIRIRTSINSSSYQVLRVLCAHQLCVSAPPHTVYVSAPPLLSVSAIPHTRCVSILLRIRSLY